MSAGTLKQRISKAVMLACAATVLGASYALDARSRFRDERSSFESPSDVIAAFQKPAFLAYMKRRQMQSNPQLKHVSVGDILPDSSVRYYGIPLRYGAPLYRCAVIGEQVVIVDPRVGRVIQVID
jgi:hypothetical protein